MQLIMYLSFGSVVAMCFAMGYHHSVSATVVASLSIVGLCTGVGLMIGGKAGTAAFLIFLGILIIPGVAMILQGYSSAAGDYWGWLWAGVPVKPSSVRDGALCRLQI